MRTSAGLPFSFYYSPASLFALCSERSAPIHFAARQDTRDSETRLRARAPVAFFSAAAGGKRKDDLQLMPLSTMCNADARLRMFIATVCVWPQWRSGTKGEEDEDGKMQGEGEKGEAHTPQQRSTRARGWEKASAALLALSWRKVRFVAMAMPAEPYSRASAGGRIDAPVA